ncbi:50S ribosomal protein L11 methyltransferase [Inhella gelatinilytica]|uniref:Ribosomal protein L11 methyltransferase n=1 Tax=Inhella gelatinilytica TaxID=2795030 RepID=A0A931IYB4_9BURK|nr:50S ribosomal protein L11 methyltransferase [Inhella gelatinilytica]MBH9553230.1 50S ribosomal protein L11 methyltransferase [Inhella gelatinilytica]
MSTLFELALICPQEQVETVSDALMELGGLSVTVEDADADSPDEQALFGEPGMPAPRAGWQRSIVKTLFEQEAAATETLTTLLAQPFAQDVHVQGLVPVDEQDWVRLTQSQFAPVPITDSFWIVPSWHEAPAQARTVMRLDPGLAFGTGTHPTTRMCLRWLARQGDLAGRRVLDYGCGSGILAIAAGLLGARDLTGVDIDPAAVTATDYNAQTNGVVVRVGLPELAVGAYDMVLANILATPLKLLAPLLCAHLKPGAPLILAGLLERQVQELQATYAPWVELHVADQEEGWVLLAGVR